MIPEKKSAASEGPENDLAANVGQASEKLKSISRQSSEDNTKAF
jgi:hypothetical protein